MVGGIVRPSCSEIFLHPYPGSLLFVAGVTYLTEHSYMKRLMPFPWRRQWDTHIKWIQFLPTLGSYKERGGRTGRNSLGSWQIQIITKQMLEESKKVRAHNRDNRIQTERVGSGREWKWKCWKNAEASTGGDQLHYRAAPGKWARVSL